MAKTIGDVLMQLNTIRLLKVGLSRLTTQSRHTTQNIFRSLSYVKSGRGSILDSSKATDLVVCRCFRAGFPASFQLLDISPPFIGFIDHRTEGEAGAGAGAVPVIPWIAPPVLTVRQSI